MSLFRTHTPKPFNQSKVLMSYSVAICCFYKNTNKYMLKLYVRLVIVIIRSFPRSSLLIGFVSELTQRVPHVEHEQFTLPEHLSSTQFQWDSCCRTFCFCMVFCRPLFIPLVIELTVVRPNAASGCPFGIFKLFSRKSMFMFNTSNSKNTTSTFKQS